MTVERKILILLGVIILALAVFGFKEKERYDYSDKRGGGFGTPMNAPAYEYSVTRFSGHSNPGWGGKGRTGNMEGHLNMMGAQGWALVSATEGTFSDERVFIFIRPVAVWR